MTKSTKTLSEKMEEALKKKAKAEKQLALLKTKERKTEDKAKILTGVLLGMLAKKKELQPGYFEAKAKELLKQAEAELVISYLTKCQPEVPRKLDQPPAE